MNNFSFINIAYACSRDTSSEIWQLFKNISILMVVTTVVALAALTIVLWLFKENRKQGIRSVFKKAFTFSLIIPAVIILGLGCLYIKQHIDTQNGIENGWYPAC